MVVVCPCTSGLAAELCALGQVYHPHVQLLAANRCLQRSRTSDNIYTLFGRLIDLPALNNISVHGITSRVGHH